MTNIKSNVVPRPKSRIQNYLRRHKSDAITFAQAWKLFCAIRSSTGYDPNFNDLFYFCVSDPFVVFTLNGTQHRVSKKQWRAIYPVAAQVRRAKKIDREQADLDWLIDDIRKAR